jgi:transcriptional regulator with XRE-family HTH domain
MESIGKIISDRIKKFRAQARLGQEELSSKAEVPFPTYRDIEYGKTKDPGVQSVSKIAAALGVSVDALISEQETPEQVKLELLRLVLSLQPDDSLHFRDQIGVFLRTKYPERTNFGVG